MNSITTLQHPVTPKDYVALKRNAILTGVAFAHEQAKDLYFTPEGDLPASITGQRAEAVFNDDEQSMYLNDTFAALIFAQTGEVLRNFSPNFVSHILGTVVRAIKPQYRDRTEDGYEVGSIYLVTNQTTGRARGFSNPYGDFKNSTNGFGAAGPMSRLGDEWELVTDQTEIIRLVDFLLDSMGTKLVDALLDENSPSFLPLLEKIGL